MFSTAVDICVTGINACFSWFAQIMDVMPGAWSTIFTLFTIIVICRFLLGPLVGVTFDAGSDRAADWIVEKRQNDRRSTEGLRKISRRG